VIGRGRTLLISLSFAVLAALPTVETALAHMQRYPDGSASTQWAFLVALTALAFPPPCCWWSVRYGTPT
jgi:hypothetical protein